MAKIDLPHRPEIDLDSLFAALQPAFADEYEVKQLQRVVQVRAKWHMVASQVRHSPDKNRTRIVVNRGPAPLALVILVPLFLLVVIPGAVVFLLMQNQARPLEDRVMQQLQQATAAA